MESREGIIGAENGRELSSETMTNTTARIAFGSIDRKYFHGEVAEVDENRLLENTGKVMDTRPIEMLAAESIWEDWKDRRKESFAEKNQKWNQRFSQFLRNKFSLKRREATATLFSLGLDPENLKEKDYLLTSEGKERRVSLVEQVEEFRKRYFGEKINIGRFIQDIAGDCKDREGRTDHDELRRRISSIKELFVLFGKRFSTHKLVEGYLNAHAIMSEIEDLKNSDPEKARELASKMAASLKRTPEEGTENELSEGFEILSRKYGVFEKQQSIITKKVLSENQIREIVKKVEAAKAKKIDPEEYKRQIEEEARLMQHYYKSKSKRKRPPETHRRELAFKKVEEFDKALELLGVNEEDRRTTAEHELAHFNEAVLYDGDPLFEIVVTSDGRTHPSTSWRIPNTYSEDQRRKITRAIISAPGERMSQGDLDMLGADDYFEVEKAIKEDEKLPAKP